MVGDWRSEMAERDEKVVLPALMDVKQVCEYLGLHRVTVVEFARLGKLPAFKVGREWRFRADEMREWMDEQRRNPVLEDKFEALWQRLGGPIRERRLSMEDVGDLIAEVRGERVEEGQPQMNADGHGSETAESHHRDTENTENGNASPQSH